MYVEVSSMYVEVSSMYVGVEYVCRCRVCM